MSQATADLVSAERGPTLQMAKLLSPIQVRRVTRLCGLCKEVDILNTASSRAQVRDDFVVGALWSYFFEVPIGAIRPDSDFLFFPARSGGRRDTAFSRLAPTQASGTSDMVRPYFSSAAELRLTTGAV